MIDFSENSAFLIGAKNMQRILAMLTSPKSAQRRALALIQDSPPFTLKQEDINAAIEYNLRPKFYFEMVNDFNLLTEIWVINDSDKRRRKKVYAINTNSVKKIQDFISQFDEK